MGHPLGLEDFSSSVPIGFHWFLSSKNPSWVWKIFCHQVFPFQFSRFLCHTTVPYWVCKILSSNGFSLGFQGFHHQRYPSKLGRFFPKGRPWASRFLSYKGLSWVWKIFCHKRSNLGFWRFFHQGSTFGFYRFSSPKGPFLGLEDFLLPRVLFLFWIFFCHQRAPLAFHRFVTQGFPFGVCRFLSHKVHSLGLKDFFVTQRSHFGSAGLSSNNPSLDFKVFFNQGSLSEVFVIQQSSLEFHRFLSPMCPPLVLECFYHRRVPHCVWKIFCQ